ncbi:MAG: winged helix-turn-helix transcriptional regulator, partial [Acetobacteraceae bacterium]|nr:winged helix-turn-helix transcriptional regulator [Acetobacteraceae bacterium]
MAALDERIDAVRAFNRFYTRLIGALQDTYLGEQFSLAEARVIYEIATARAPGGAALRESLGLDPGYFSRIIQRLDNLGLVVRARDKIDRRRAAITLTPRG